MNKKNRAIELLDEREKEITRELKEIREAKEILNNNFTLRVKTIVTRTQDHSGKSTLKQAPGTKSVIADIICDRPGINTATVRKHLCAKLKKSYRPRSIVTYLYEMKKVGMIERKKTGWVIKN